MLGALQGDAILYMIDTRHHHIKKVTNYYNRTIANEGFPSPVNRDTMKARRKNETSNAFHLDRAFAGVV